MPAKLTVYLPNSPAGTTLLDESGAACTIGRSTIATVVIDHGTISREHARLEYQDGGWALTDNNSKNGSYVDASEIRNATLSDSHWLRFGDIYCHFETISEAQLEADQRQTQKRWEMTEDLARHISTIKNPESILREVLAAMLDMGQFERGFILRADPLSDEIQVVAQHNDGASAVDAFSGTTSAVQRCLDTRESIVYYDINTQHWLASKASVVAQGIRSLAVIPLIDQDQILGVVYCDRHTNIAPLTELDLSIIKAFANQATLALSLAIVNQSINELVDEVQGSDHDLSQQVARAVRLPGQ